MAAPSGHMIRSDEYAPDLELGADNISGGSPPHSPGPQTPLISGLPRQGSRLHHLTEAPAQQVRANIVAEVRAAHISAFCAVLLRLIEVALIGAVLLRTWNRPCDRPLQLYLLVTVLLQCVATGLQLSKRPGEPTPPGREWVPRAERMLSSAIISWFICGNVWVFGSTSCDATLRTAAALLIYLTYACLSLPLLLLLLVIFCLPFLALCLPFILHYFPAAPAVPAASPEQISTLTERVFCPGDYAADEASCCICLDDYAAADALRVLPCGHHFHRSCLDRWLKTSAVCPLCKMELFRPAGSTDSEPPPPPPGSLAAHMDAA